MKIYTFLTTFFLLVLFTPGEKCFTAEKPVIYFGVNLRYQPIIMYKRYQPLMDYLTQNTPYEFRLKISHDYNEALEYLAEGKTHIISPGDGALMEAILLLGAKPIVKPVNKDGKPFYRSALIAPSKSSVTKLQDIKGKKVAFGYYHSITGNLIPRDLLIKNGIKLEELGSVSSLRNQDAVAKAVVKGEYDLGAVKDVIVTRYNHGLRVVAYSGLLPSIPLVASEKTPKEVVKAVADALLKLDRRNPSHRKLMDSWDDEYKYGFVPATISDYRDISRMFRSIPFGCGTGCH